MTQEWPHYENDDSSNEILIDVFLITAFRCQGQLSNLHNSLRDVVTISKASQMENRVDFSYLVPREIQPDISK
jgi:hypothetical protein